MIGPVVQPPAMPPPEASDTLRDTASDLEQAFVQEMLKHAGLAEAFGGGGGAASDAFSGFLLEAVAEQIVEQGGFGLAKRFYGQLARHGEAAPAGSGQRL